MAPTCRFLPLRLVQDGVWRNLGGRVRRNFDRPRNRSLGLILCGSGILTVEAGHVDLLRGKSGWFAGIPPAAPAQSQNGAAASNQSIRESNARVRTQRLEITRFVGGHAHMRVRLYIIPRAGVRVRVGGRASPSAARGSQAQRQIAKASDASSTGTGRGHPLPPPKNFDFRKLDLWFRMPVRIQVPREIYDPGIWSQVRAWRRGGKVS